MARWHWITFSRRHLILRYGRFILLSPAKVEQAGG